MRNGLVALAVVLIALSGLGCDGEASGTPTQPEGSDDSKATRTPADTAAWISTGARSDGSK